VVGGASYHPPPITYVLLPWIPASTPLSSRSRTGTGGSSGCGARSRGARASRAGGGFAAGSTPAAAPAASRESASARPARRNRPGLRAGGIALLRRGPACGWRSAPFERAALPGFDLRSGDFDRRPVPPQRRREPDCLRSLPGSRAGGILVFASPGLSTRFAASTTPPSGPTAAIEWRKWFACWRRPDSSSDAGFLSQLDPVSRRRPERLAHRAPARQRSPLRRHLGR